MEPAIVVGLALVGVGLLLFAIHHAALWMESRGWIYYRTKGKGGGAGAMAAMEIASMLEPEIAHVVEEIRSEKLRSEQNETGEGIT